MKRQARWCIMAAAAAAALSGCVGMQPSARPKTQLVADADSVMLRLAEAADRAASSLEVLAAVEQSRTPSPGAPVLDDVPPALRQSVTVSWIGPVEPIVGRLAGRAGYSFGALGDAPPVPVIVTVDARDTPLIDVLRDIGLQAGGRADVTVDAYNQTIEVQYAPVTWGEGL